MFVRAAARRAGARTTGPAGLERRRAASRRRALEAYAENPCAGATLLLRAEKWHRGKLDKLVAKVGAVIKCEQPKDARCRAPGPWPRARIATGWPSISPAAQLLVGRVGPGLARLDTELAKLAAFVGPGRRDRPRRRG